jgi:molecular chaperone DnaJ
LDIDRTPSDQGGLYRRRLMSQDPYSVLGVDSSSSQEEIVAAFKSLAAKYHPDRNPQNPKEAAARFKEVVAAYEIVGDESRRRQYDFYRNSSFPSFSFRSRNSVDDIFDGLFSQFFGGSNHGHQHTRLRVKVSLAEAFRGCSKKVSFDSIESCSACAGTGSSEWRRCDGCGGSGFLFVNQGSMRIQTSCSRCSGSGSISGKACQECNGRGGVAKSRSELEVAIPPGVDDGVQIRIHREDAGDVFVVVNVEKHNYLSRHHSNLIGSMEVSYYCLIFGGETIFEVFGESISIKIPPRTRVGTRMRIKGRGMPKMQNPSVRGDLFLDVKLRMPDPIEGEYESLLKKLSKFEDQ